MKTIFEQGTFAHYSSSVVLGEERTQSISHSEFKQKKITVFISHKHDDLDDLKGVIGFLEQKYNVKVYIDSKDPKIPKVTSAETARKIKEQIEQSDRYILLATNGAIESKWCNWELGYGDAVKFREKSIAIFPFKPKAAKDDEYKGSEYMRIYPSISYVGENEHYETGKPIIPGYYVKTNENGKIYIQKLEEWLEKR